MPVRVDGFRDGCGCGSRADFRNECLQLFRVPGCEPNVMTGSCQKTTDGRTNHSGANDSHTHGHFNSQSMPRFEAASISRAPKRLSERPNHMTKRPTPTSSLEGNPHPVTVEIEPHDVLSDALTSLGLRSRVFCRSELRAPWGLTAPAGDFAHFHLISEGRGYLHLHNGRMPLLLSGGDLVVLPRGEGHVLSDSAANVPAAIDYPVKERRGALVCFANHGIGPASRIICGSFQVRRRNGGSLLSLLPDVLHIQGRGGQPPEWLAGISALLVSEAQERRLGRSAIMTRLTDVLLVQVLRHWIDLSTDRARPLLALRDARISSVLALIHANLERSLSIDELARQAAMSRSAFAARFTDLVGEPPARYIARWRMQRASDLVLNTSLPVTEIASATGYATAAAFDKAFSRHFHTSPGAYRLHGRERRPRLVAR